MAAVARWLARSHEVAVLYPADAGTGREDVRETVEDGVRWLGLGIVGSLVAFHVYGMTDAIALGTKPGVAFWMILALSAALWRTSPESVGSSASAAEGPLVAGT